VKKIYQDKTKYILRLDGDEEFVDTVQGFCEQENIKSGWIQAIGSTKDLDLAFFDTKLKEYEIKKFKEFLEIVTITGNVSLKENKQFVHAHGLFGRQNMDVVGGHIHRCVISATAEVVIFVGEGDIKREFNDQMGLHLLS